MQMKYPLREQTENTGYQCFEIPSTKAIYTEMHEGISGATFTLQDNGKGSSAVDQCTPEKHGRKAGKPLRKTQALTEVESPHLFWSLLISNKRVC